MSRGFASGVLWGSVVSVLGLGVVSLLALPPANLAPANLPTADLPPANTLPANTPPVDAAAVSAEQPPVATIVTTQTAGNGFGAGQGPQPGGAEPEAILPPGPRDAPPPTTTLPATLAATEVEDAPGTVELLPPPPLTPEEEALLVPPPAAEPQTAPADIAPVDPVGLPGEQQAGEPTSVPDDPELSADPEASTGSGAPAPSDPGARLAPVQAFARPFANPDRKPMFAVLLEDTGEDGVDRESLAHLPFPVTFVLDPTAAGAREAAGIYRAAGQEVVLLMAGMASGATTADLIQGLQSGQASLPEAVAVAELSESGLQEDRPLSMQIVPVIGAQGRGLVTFDRGMNSADQVARRSGIPSVRIFRRLDARAEGVAAVRRYLDRAVVRAGQERRVAVLGDTHPETVQAILEWSIEGRGAQVAMAPLTAVLSPD